MHFYESTCATRWSSVHEVKNQQIRETSVSVKGIVMKEQQKGEEGINHIKAHGTNDDNDVIKQGEKRSLP